MINTKEITILEKDYLQDLKDYLQDLNNIKETIKTNQAKAMVVVNSAMIMTYYEIGTIINQRKVWGNKYIERLSNDLKDYGNGYSCEQLKKMSQFAKEFSENEIRLQPVTQIPWGTLITVILPKSKSHEEMVWYINRTYKNDWSRSEADKFIAETTLSNSLTYIGISKYKVIEELPNYLAKRLNNK